MYIYIHMYIHIHIYICIHVYTNDHDHITCLACLRGGMERHGMSPIPYKRKHIKPCLARGHMLFWRLEVRGGNAQVIRSGSLIRHAMGGDALCRGIVFMMQCDLIICGAVCCGVMPYHHMACAVCRCDVALYDVLPCHLVACHVVPQLMMYHVHSMPK